MQQASLQWLAVGSILRGWARSASGETSDGISWIEDGTQNYRATGAVLAMQVRALASNYDAAFNRQDAATVAGLYAEDAVFNTPEGRFQGRQAIEELYTKNTTDRLTVHKSWTRRQCPIVRLAFFQRPKKRMRSWLAALKFKA